MKNVVINGITYSDVPQVSIPLAQGGGNATFYDTTDATASASDILAGKTAYAGGAVTGSMVNNGRQAGTITTKAGTVTIAQGYHNGSGSVGISSTEQSKIVATNIRAGVSILGVSGNSNVVNTSDADAVAGNILSGKKAYVRGSLITGTLTAVTVTQDNTTKVLTIE